MGISWRACVVWSIELEIAIELVLDQTPSPNFYVLDTDDDPRLSPTARRIGFGSMASAEWGSKSVAISGDWTTIGKGARLYVGMIPKAIALLFRLVRQCIVRLASENSLQHFGGAGSWDAPRHDLIEQ
ncbi:hypothetical protein ANO14919_039940 [Xylariales sp. No.14919]|nr:hypothetical protein ANO14919_039940 [Xylariales sp. No.14919]